MLKAGFDILRKLFVLPHEILHQFFFGYYGEQAEIVYGDRFSEASVIAEFKDSTPILSIRIGAIAPTIFYPLLALSLEILIGIQLSVKSLEMLFLLILFLKWSHPSSTDLSVFYNARYFREKGDNVIDYDLTYGPKLVSNLALAILAAAGLILFS